MPSLSLQTLWVSSQADQHHPSTAIAVGPRGFKSALQSLINFLIKHEIRANLWLKLPKDDAWWTDVWQYGQQAAGCTVYALGKQDCIVPNHSTENLAASFRSIAIEQDNDLKREYLCVAVADNFVGALLATRVPAGVSCPDKRNLKLYSTINSTTVSAIGQGLKQIVEHSIAQQSQGADGDDSPPQTASVSDALLASHAMLSQWNRYFPPSLHTRQSWPLSDAYLSWQLQFQEELRSEIAACRSAEKNSTSATLQSLPADFLAQAGQELQAPLTTIKTALTLLGSPALKLAQRQRYLEMIATQCGRQKSLIDSVIQLLQLQTTEVAATQPIQLADLIPGIVSTYQPIAEERGIMLAYTIPSNLAPVSGVESELKEVLIHLINNSIQATPKSGRVWVEATPHDAHRIALTVKDSGAGMSKTDAARLFEAFYRQPSTQGQEAGVGLGLTLAQQLIQRVGGSIRADSELEKGTTLQILLPIHPVENRNSRPSTPLTDPSPSAAVSRPGSFKNSLASV
ncbi:MAG: ATP-binding protein [Phormidesmis sp.]